MSGCAVPPSNLLRVGCTSVAVVQQEEAICRDVQPSRSGTFQQNFDHTIIRRFLHKFNFVTENRTAFGVVRHCIKSC